MANWLPPGYLTIDQVLFLFGAEMFGDAWTGAEANAGRVQSPEYWADQARARREHSKRAQRAAVSISGGRYLGDSRPSTSIRSKRGSQAPLIPHWSSEEYRLNYLKDRDATARFHEVGSRVIEACWYGKYEVYWREPAGTFSLVDKIFIQSDAFQQFITDPNTPYRDRVFFFETATRSAPTANGIAGGQETNNHLGPTEEVLVVPEKEIDLLAEWIFAQHPPNGGPVTNRRDLLEMAQKEPGLKITAVYFTAAYQKVYETKRGRQFLSGWPLREPFKSRK